MLLLATKTLKISTVPRRSREKFEIVSFNWCGDTTVNVKMGATEGKERVLFHLTDSPNQVLTHAARAAAKQLNKPLCGLFSHSVAARGAREGPWSGQPHGLRILKYGISISISKYFYNRLRHDLSSTTNTTTTTMTKIVSKISTFRSRFKKLLWKNCVDKFQPAC